MPASCPAQDTASGVPSQLSHTGLQKSSGLLSTCWTVLTLLRNFSKEAFLTLFRRRHFPNSDEIQTLISPPGQISAESHDEQERSNTEHHIDPNGQFYMSRADRCSEKELIEDCRALNNKIRGTVLNAVVEWTMLSERETRISTTRLQPEDHVLQKTLRSILGESLYSSIDQLRESHSTLEVIEGPVTDALQTITSYTAHHIISELFCPVLHEHWSDFIVRSQDVFRGMISHERQAIALHWRALTYVHAMKSMQDERVSAINDFVSLYESRLARCFQAIFSLSGESTSSSFVAKIPQLLSNCGIIESAIEFSEKLKTSIFSTYIDTCWATPKIVFDENLMEKDGCIGTLSSQQTLVACTLELGIREIVVARTDAQDQIGRVLLKPKVLVEGM